jgi:nucleotidyltransferase/DNA polymerase involved in DNA repair
MDTTLFQLHSWPRAVIHVDGDAFFTSCEEAIHPELRGKPVIAGGERGIVACASYAAKERGITRGIPLHEAKRRCPELVILPSDYETYSLFSRRLFNIMRRFTPQVEEYSIDEAFADITGLRRKYSTSYINIARAIKAGIRQELGISITLGLSLTKVLAKVASKHEKPDGFTAIPGRAIPLFLRDLPVEKIWGIGHATTHYLSKLGVRTALEFARLPETMVRRHFTKPGREIWMELRGESVYPVVSEEKSTYASISKTKTFAPPTADREYLFAQLLRNVESACIKARRYYLAPRKIAVFLKKNDFAVTGVEAKLYRPSAYPLELTGLVKELFESLYRSLTVYRATGAVLLDLREDRYIQYSLFESPVKIEKIEKVYEAADFLGKKYGKHTLHLGASHPLDRLGTGRRGEPTARAQTRFSGETLRKHLGLPILHVKV